MTESLDADRLRALIDYDPDTGEFRWKSGSKGQLAGARAGGVNSQGYVHIRIDGKLYKAHRLAWLYCFGAWPALMIDHINRDKSDNRIANLRDVSRSVNHKNRNVLANNTSGYTGVSYDKRANRWQAYIKLGSFSTAEEAGAAYEHAKSLIEGKDND